VKLIWYTGFGPRVDIIESGVPREVFHYALLVGYGTRGIAVSGLETWRVIEDGDEAGVDGSNRVNYINAIGKAC
jgi:hypothetical protein